MGWGGGYGNRERGGPHRAGALTLQLERQVSIMFTGFNYFAVTSGVKGTITRPFVAEIEEQAAAQAPVKGGFSSVTKGPFNFHDLISFDRATAFAAAAFSEADQAFDATAAISIEGFNLFNMVTADRIVARVSSSHPKSGAEPRITPIGCSFENLRIAGYKVETDLAIDVFSEFSTATSLRSACTDPAQSARVKPQITNLPDQALAAAPVSGTLLRSIRGLGREISTTRNAVTIPDFGTIFLAEVTVEQRKRTVTMIRFALGSVPAGGGQVGGASGNGDGF
jgi:hypothetical protein